MCVAKNELEELLKHPDVSRSPLPIIFFANKMDVPGALTPVECSQQLELERISDRPWHIAHALPAQSTLPSRFCLFVVFYQVFSSISTFRLLRSSNALIGTGIDEGLEWLASHVSPKGHK